MNINKASAESTQSPQTLSLAFTRSSSARLRSSLALFSRSLKLVSYAFCSSVRRGARIPSAPAIMRAAAELVFSGLRPSSLRVGLYVV